MNRHHRHPQNSNLRLYSETTYLGFPVKTKRGPLIEEYLDRLYLTMQRALNEHPRTFAFRIDLRFPMSFDTDPYLESSSVIESFIESLKAKIKHNRALAKKKNGYTHGTAVRYVWAREVGDSGRPHFHFVMFLNNDAFHSLGMFETGRDNLFNRLQGAWAKALGLSMSEVEGLVEVPDESYYCLRLNDPSSISAFFKRASYLCKAATKFYGNGCHGFGSSRC